MENELFDKAEEIRELVIKIKKNIKNLISDYVSDLNLTWPQAQLIKELHKSERLELTNLSSRMGLANSTVSGIVDRLEKQNTVERYRDEDDRRVVWISLNKDFRVKMEAIPLFQKDFFANLLQDLEMSEINKIVDSLQILEGLLEKKISKTD